MPPFLDRDKTRVHGHVFLGLSLTRKSSRGHADSITLQEAFDLNDVVDRDYVNIMSSNDDGWLVGGGEPGPPTSYKLAAKDSSHVEITSIGNYRPEWGGVTEEEIVDVMRSGKILIPQIEVLPTAVVANPDHPPELEIRFDMEPWVPPDLNKDLSKPLPINWALRFIHNQLFEHFSYPARFCPGAFHSTILRKAEWRSPKHKKAYFDKCDAAIQRWRSKGPQALNAGGWDVDGSRLQSSSSSNNNNDKNNSGIWLFRDRDTITHFFAPNFLPPYDTVEKRNTIMKYIQNEWDEKTKKFYPAGQVPRVGDDIDGVGCFANIVKDLF